MLNLPDAKLQIRLNEKGKQSVYDLIRRKWVALTPEEWVRQHLLHYLVLQLNYPRGRMGVEKSIQVLGMQLRADILVFDSKGSPVMIIECKSPDVPLSTEVFAQAAKYNLKLRVPYLLISNGVEHYCARINLKDGAYKFKDRFPTLAELNRK